MKTITKVFVITISLLIIGLVVIMIRIGFLRGYNPVTHLKCITIDKGSYERDGCLIFDWRCIQKYPDGGKKCTNKSHCQGDCRGKWLSSDIEGACTNDNHASCGCYKLFDKTISNEFLDICAD